MSDGCKRHVGGHHGLAWAKERLLGGATADHRFVVFEEAGADGKIESACEEWRDLYDRDDKAVFMVDASRFVRTHGDVVDLPAGTPSLGQHRLLCRGPGGNKLMLPSMISRSAMGLLSIAAVGVLAACASTSEQAASCAFGDAPAGGAPTVSHSIKAGVYEGEGGALIEGGPEDFAVFKMGDGGATAVQTDGDRWRLYISTVKRGGKSHPGNGDIRTVVFDAAAGKFEDDTLVSALPEEFEGKFHPVGMSLVDHGDQLFLYVINKRDKDNGGEKGDLNRIEKFLIDRESGGLTYEDSLKSRGLVDANDLLVTTDKHIYVSNPRIVHVFDARGEDYSQWPSLVHLDGSKRASGEDEDDVFRRGDRQFNFANGVAAPRADRLIVADFFDGVLVVFARDEQSGELRHLFDIDLDGAGSPDNLMLSDDQEKLYVAAHRSLLRSFGHLIFGWTHAPSAVFELDVTEKAIDKSPVERLAPKLVLDDGGEHLKAASTALAIGKYMVVSQLKEPEIYAFACR